MESLKNYAYEFHALSLFVPQDKREAVITLYEFYVELATIRKRIKNGLAGEVRLQWWKDTLEKGEAASPLASAVLGVISRYNLPLLAFTNMCSARVFDMYDDGFKDWAEFEGYCGETICTLFQLTALVLNDGKPVDTGELAGHAGLAYALSSASPFADSKAQRAAHFVKAKPLFKTCAPHLRPAFLLYNVNSRRSALQKFLRLALN